MFQLIASSGSIYGAPFSLPEKEVRNIEAAFSELGQKFSLRAFRKNGLFDYQQPHVFTAIAQAFEGCLVRNSQYLRAMLFDLEINPIVYLEGFPVGEPPETPKSITSKVKPHISEFVSIGLLGLAGRKLEGLKMGNVVLREEDNLKAIAGSDFVYEPSHTHADMADFGVLYCLNGTQKVTSQITTTENLYFALRDSAYQKLLFKKLHYFGVDKAPVALMQPHPEGKMEFVFSPEFTSSDDFISFATELVKKMYEQNNPDALEAAGLMLDIINNWLSAIIEIQYKAGDVAIINQRSTLRGIFIDGLHTPEVEQRYLLSTTAKLGEEIDKTHVMNIADARRILQCSQATQR